MCGRYDFFTLLDSWTFVLLQLLHLHLLQPLRPLIRNSGYLVVNFRKFPSESFWALSAVRRCSLTLNRSRRVTKSVSLAWRWHRSVLGLDKHVVIVCATCCYCRRQLTRVRRSLDAHAFVTSRVDNCNAIHAGTSKSSIDKLQQILNAAARVVSDKRKYDRGLSHLLHDELHWLDVPQPVQYK